jgi:hypothetical protein
VVAFVHERLHLLAARLALCVAGGADDRADLGRNDVTVRMNRDEEATALEGEADAAT